MADRTDARKPEAKRLYLEKNWTHAAIASHLGVSTRTVERWASSDGWGGLKQSKVINIGERQKGMAVSPDAAAAAAAAAGRRAVRPGRSVEMDEREIVNGAIADLSAALSVAEDERSLGGLAGGLVRLLEYRRKSNPPTAGELAEMLLALNINPSDFVKELRDRWQLKA